MTAILQIVDGIFSLFNMALILWCLLSWFPNVNRYENPWRYLSMIVEPVLAPIRRVVPTIGNIDISPMVLVIAINFILRLVHSLLNA
jgi:YggT family protein